MSALMNYKSTQKLSIEQERIYTVSKQNLGIEFEMCRIQLFKGVPNPPLLSLSIMLGSRLKENQIRNKTVIFATVEAHVVRIWSALTMVRVLGLGMGFAS